MLRGVDISYANHIIDYDRLASQIDFAIIRAGYGKSISQEDVRFREHFNNLSERGVLCGAYWYSYAKDEAEAVEEARSCLEVIKNKPFDMPIYFDFEEEIHAKMSPDKLSEIVKAFCSILEQHGYWVGIYSYKSMLNRVPKLMSRYATWCATIDGLPPSLTGMLQYSWKGDGSKFGQSKGTIDLDICGVNYPELIRKANKNNL